MSDRKLYLLSDTEAKTLRALARESATTVSNHALDALTPVAVGDLGNEAVERMARAIMRNAYGGNVDLLNYNTWDVARGDARAALAALLQEDE